MINPLKKQWVKSILLASLVCVPCFAEVNPSNSATEAAILVLINAYRQSLRLAPLKNNANIVNEAKTHSTNMAKKLVPFGHAGFHERMTRLFSAIKGSGAGAENVAYNYTGAEEVVKSWLKSAGHKRNIEGNYNLTGIGVERDEQNRIYYTQIFIRQTAAQ